MNGTGQMPEALRRCLRQSASRVRRIIAVRGVCGVVAVFLLAFGALMAVDLMTILFSAALRWGLWAAAAAVTAWSVCEFLVKPLRTDLSPERVARMIEMRHPELEERLSSVAELSQCGSDAGFSAELLQSLTAAALADVRGIAPSRVFGFRKSAPKIAAAGGLLLLFAVLFAVFPRAMAILFVRAVLPAAEVGNLYSAQMQVEPGDVVLLKGSDLHIAVKHEIFGKGRTYIRIARDGGAETPERMAVSEDDGAWRRCEWKMQAVREDFTYRINCGHALSQRFAVKAVARPAADNLRVAVEYPPHTGLGTVFHPAANVPPLVEGCSAAIVFSPSRDDLSAKLVWNGQETELAGKRSGEWSFSAMKLETAQEIDWRLLLDDAHGFTNNLQQGKIKVVADEPPSVDFAGDVRTRTFAARFGEADFEFAAKDDCGLDFVGLWIAEGNGEFAFKRRLETVRTAGKARTTAATGRFAVDAKDYPPEARTVWLKIKLGAVDNRPAEYGGAQTNFSPVAEVSFGNANESSEMWELRVVEQRTLHAIQRMENALQDLAKAAKSREDAVNRGFDEKNREAVRQLSEALQGFRRRVHGVDNVAAEFVRMEAKSEIMREQQDKIAEFAETEIVELKQIAQNALVTDMPERKRQPQIVREASEQSLEALRGLREGIKAEFDLRRDAMLMAALSQEAEALAMMAGKEDANSGDLLRRGEELSRRLEGVRQKLATAEAKQALADLAQQTEQARAAMRAAADAKSLAARSKDPAARAAAAERAAELARLAAERTAAAAKAFGEAAEAAQSRLDGEETAEDGEASDIGDDRPRKRRKGRKSLEPAAAIRGDGDWFKFKSKIENSAAEDKFKDVPEEYRELVREYFEELNREKQ